MSKLDEDITLFDHWNTGCEVCKESYYAWWNSVPHLPDLKDLRPFLCPLGIKLFDQSGIGL